MTCGLLCSSFPTFCRCTSIVLFEYGCEGMMSLSVIGAFYFKFWILHSYYYSTNFTVAFSVSLQSEKVLSESLRRLQLMELSVETLSVWFYVLFPSLGIFLLLQSLQFQWLSRNLKKIFFCILLDYMFGLRPRILEGLSAVWKSINQNQFGNLPRLLSGEFLMASS